VDLEALYAGLSLPSGFYQWEITAFLADQRQVSNVGMAMMTVYKNNPPQITFPQNNAVLMNTGFQSINFTWMPRHRYSTNAAAGTIYTFKIYEIPTEEGEETDPNIIVNSGVLPLFSTQTFGTNYNYKPSDPLLMPGRRYVIQVQAADINGQDEFENNGLSEVSTFSFGNPSEAPAIKPCKKPTNVLAEKLDEQSVQLTWQESNSEAPIDYLVSYKTENEGVWTERIVQEQSLVLIQLAPAKYQFRVSARCTYDNKSAFTTPESIELSKPEEEKETPEAEPQDTYVNTDEPVTPPTVYEPETEPEPAIDPLNTPLRIILDPSENPSLPDTLKLPKGYENLGSLPVLGDKPTAEQLKAALKTKKPDCSALLANYQCGQNDIPSVPSGDIIQPNVGDEIAINSIAFEIVDLDGSGNGRGIVKVPMFNNAKFGVKFENIKVARGGCVVSGQAILSDVDVALLSEEQRKKLAETYATFNKVLAIADSLAPEIAETYNSISDFVQKFKQGLSNYVGGAKDAIVMKKQFKAAEKYADLLLKNKNLSDSTRNGLKAAYDEALATKDFFCSGKECQEGKANPKKGGPFGEFDYTVSLCEENKAKVAKLQDLLSKGEKEVNDNTPKKNLCGEYYVEKRFQYLTLSTGMTQKVEYYDAPPKGKKAVSTLFSSEVEFYQYIITRTLLSGKTPCKKFSFGENTYLDEEFYKKRDKLYLFLNSGYSPIFSYPLFKNTFVKDDNTLNKFKVLVLQTLFDETQNQANQVKWIESIYDAQSSYELGEVAAIVTDMVLGSGEAFYVSLRKSLSNSKLLSRFIKEIPVPNSSNILRLLTKDEFINAISKGEDNLFYVGTHEEISPRPRNLQNEIFESHHGVNDIWMEQNFLNNNKLKAPSIYMLKNPNHNATRSIFPTWKADIARTKGIKSTEKNFFSKVSEEEILILSEKQFDAANVPMLERAEYYKKWREFKSTLKPIK
jgi:hypothetical protein